jgi:prepilin-type N-terminal cleavage/methylation domain-containing protein
MRTVSCWSSAVNRNAKGFTLVEVVISMAIAGAAFVGVLYGYVMTTNQGEWSCFSLAAHSVAMQGVEQARSAKWDPQAWPSVDELGVTNYVQVATLDVPTRPGNTLFATNYVSVTTASEWPALRQIRSDCVWVLPYRKGRTRGPFTNTVITLRAADQ